jgi:hypothetical protein
MQDAHVVSYASR